MNRKQIDDLFDDIFDEALREEMNMVIPDPEQSWDRMSRRLEKRSGKRRIKKRLRMVGTMVGALLLGALIFSSPQESRAFLPIHKLVENVRDDVITFFQGDSKKMKQEPEGMLTSPPPPGVGPIMGEGDMHTEKDNIVVYTLEAAQQATTTTLPAIGLIPLGYKLSKIELAIDSSQVLLNESLFYLDSNTGGFINLVVTRIVNGSFTSISRDKEQSHAEKIRVRGMEGVAITQPGKGPNLIWGDHLFSYNLSADRISKEEMIKLAESVE
ncbi:MAG: hypothetical protein K0R57_3885 [Paenibacillaceae bacterium]|nr:hypothetical protein [Paenibacillaceae bacterium]